MKTVSTPLDMKTAVATMDRGEKRASPWGLYDVHGNVWEWTASRWKSYYSGREAGIQVDPAKPAVLAAGGGERVIRGGGFTDSANWPRAACRSGRDPRTVFGDRGFRVLLPAGPERP